MKGQYITVNTVTIPVNAANTVLALSYTLTCPCNSGLGSLLLLSWFLSCKRKEWLEADCIPPLPQPVEHLYFLQQNALSRVGIREAVCLRTGTGDIRSC